jgi:hypothetical protein
VEERHNLGKPADPSPKNQHGAGEREKRQAKVAGKLRRETDNLPWNLPLKG